MKELIIQIPDQKEPLLRELFHELGCVIVGQTEEIPLEHQELVKERIQTEDSHKFYSWNEVQEKYKK